VGDFNGDGKADILWRNDKGSLLVWEMDGLTAKVTATLGDLGSNWHVA